MLTLQRASAGSGKTFTLARQFIWFFITIRPDGEERRLRTDAELDDSLSHILAVTFTNKATNEMQMRIRQFVYLNKIYKIVFLEYHIERSKFTYVVEISSLFLMRSKMLDPFGFAQGDSNISELLN